VSLAARRPSHGTCPRSPTPPTLTRLTTDLNPSFPTSDRLTRPAHSAE
jgi:hypothetical protein